MPRTYRNIKIKNLSYKEKQRKVMASSSCQHLTEEERNDLNMPHTIIPNANIRLGSIKTISPESF